MNIQKQMIELFGHSCLAYCYVYLYSPNRDVKTLTKYVLEGWYEEAIEDDGFVSQPLKLIYLVCGKHYKNIVKVKIDDLKQLPRAGIFAVEYKCPTGGSHFVVASRDGVVFDPSGESNSVKNGIVLSYRKIL